MKGHPLATYAPVPEPYNEPIEQYSPGTPARRRLEQLLGAAAPAVELKMTIGGRKRLGQGMAVDVVQPHSHASVLGTMQEASAADTAEAIEAALQAAVPWRRMSFEDRAAIFLKAADLLAGPWRERLVVATMLGQSKTAIQAEIDAACELIDFWRFNVKFAENIACDQPRSAPGVWNRSDTRPLRGVRVRDNALQLHGDQQSADGTRIDGKRRGVEAIQILSCLPRP